jgi:hypothetical protein
MVEASPPSRKKAGLGRLGPASAFPRRLNSLRGLKPHGRPPGIVSSLFPAGGPIVALAAVAQFFDRLHAELHSTEFIRGRCCEPPHRDQLDLSRVEARTGRGSAREPAVRQGWSKPVGRAAQRLRSSAREAVRSPAANCNRDPRSAIPVRMLRAALRPPGEAAAVRRHTAETRTPGAGLARPYTVEASLAPGR